MYTIEFTSGRESVSCELWGDVLFFLDGETGIKAVQLHPHHDTRYTPFWSLDDGPSPPILGYVINLNKEASINGKKITIRCREQDVTTYESEGVLLADGRLLTYGTGVDGRDSLWASTESYTPNGLAVYDSHEVSDETVSLTIEEIMEADTDNTTYGGRSLLTETERLVRDLRTQLAEVTAERDALVAKVADYRKIIDDLDEQAFIERHGR